MYSQTIETLRLDYHFLRNRNTKAICVEANGSRLDQVVRWHTEKFPPEVFRMVGVCLYFYRQQAIRHWHGRCRWLESRRCVVWKALQIRRGGTAVCANCGLQEGFEVLGYSAVDSWKIGIRTTISPGDNPNQGCSVIERIGNGRAVHAKEHSLSKAAFFPRLINPPPESPEKAKG